MIPFDNTIGKDTALYKLYNTNIHEKIAEGLMDNKLVTSKNSYVEQSAEKYNSWLIY